MYQVKIFTFNPIEENTYVLFNEYKECLVIDPGSYFPEEKEKLQMFIDENQLVPKILLNTHCHLDHVFGNKFVSEAFGLTLHLSKKEEPVLQMAPASGLLFNMPFDNYQGEFVFLKEGDSVFLGADQLLVLETPGHSPGSISLYCDRQRFIISGDVLFQNSIGRTDLPGGDYQTLVDSIKQKLFVLPDDVKVYSGHGPVTTIGAEKKYNPFVGVSG